VSECGTNGGSDPNDNLNLSDKSVVSPVGAAMLEEQWEKKVNNVNIQLHTKEEVVRNRHGLCKQIKSDLVRPTRQCRHTFIIFYLRRNKDEDCKKSSHKLDF
jgi:hypothetical protein